MISMDSDNTATPQAQNKPPTAGAAQAQPKERSTLKLLLGAVVIMIIVGAVWLATHALTVGSLNNACTTLPASSNSTFIVLVYPTLSFLQNGSKLVTDYSSVEVHTNNGWFCTNYTGGLSMGTVPFFDSAAAQVIAIAPVRNIDINEIRLQMTPAPGGFSYNGVRLSPIITNSTIVAGVSSSSNIPSDHIVILFVNPTLNASGAIPILDLGSPAAFVDQNISISFPVLAGRGIGVGSQTSLQPSQVTEIEAAISK
jgi:hypothetical protein